TFAFLNKTLPTKENGLGVVFTCLTEKPASVFFCFGGGRKRNDFPRHYTQKKAAYRSVLPDVRNKPFRRVSDC
ncbi:hypothetical protein, partial [Escherichia coli]|uniref:hypothetical protein n=1 Tax=Escherichia coli TaxID=562 RepID=UPI003D34EFC5